MPCKSDWLSVNSPFDAILDITPTSSSDPYHELGSTVYPFLSEREKLADQFSVARVRPRTSKGITDLLLLRFVWLNATCTSKKLTAGTVLIIPELFSRQESRSLSELTRQIAPRTKNGHAPPTTESRKSSQPVCHNSVRAG